MTQTEPESRQLYFKGADKDFFVKAVGFGGVVFGELTRYTVGDESPNPDAWTVYSSDTNPHVSAVTCFVVSDFFDKKEAVATAKQLALENKTEALLLGNSL